MGKLTITAEAKDIVTDTPKEIQNLSPKLILLLLT